MELIRVAIKNFQSIKQEEVIKVNNTITTIIGLNESGKSTVLKAIKKLNGEKIEKKEKNKDRKYKNEESYITGRFFIKCSEIENINKQSNNKVLLFPEKDIYVDVTIKDESTTRYFSISEKNGKSAENFNMLDILINNLIRVTNELFIKYKLEKSDDFDEKLKEAEDSNLEDIYKALIASYQGQNIYTELSALSCELKEDLWIDLVPKYKIIIFSSSDILSDEVLISEAKNSIQVNNLLKIANINIDELIDNVKNDDNEELKTYEGIYMNSVTRMFKKIFRQNDSEFNFQIRIDTKNNKFYSIHLIKLAVQVQFL